MSFRWITSPTDIFPAMATRYMQAIFQGSRRVLHEQAAQMEEWARANAPWQDRTGAARATLSARVDESGPVGTIVLSHGVPYGLWLEIANQGRFAIIAPAIDYWSPRIMGALQHMIASGALPGFTFSGSVQRFRNVATGRFVSRGEIASRLG